MFKQDFKYYKSKTAQPDLSSVLNFDDLNALQTQVKPLDFISPEESWDLYGLKPINDWLGYEVVSNPGLIYIRNPFTTTGQQYWITQCLRDYTDPPNKTNLDTHNLIPENCNWWQIVQNQQDNKIIEKLRWVTLGYHHDWDTKVYNNSKNDFPDNLARLSSFVASTIGYNNFRAEAAIVNYYHMDSTLSGHTDHSEEVLEAPLLSFSFGQSAIFLLGGVTLDIKPTALFLQSGDIVIMSKESRLCYHGVPRIVRSSEEQWTSNCNDTTWKFCKNYMKNSRININVRQVF